LQPPSEDGITNRVSAAGAIQKREESLRESELCGPAFAKATFL